jgi:hypothetical protein
LSGKEIAVNAWPGRVEECEDYKWMKVHHLFTERLTSKSIPEKQKNFLIKKRLICKMGLLQFEVYG